VRRLSSIAGFSFGLLWTSARGNAEIGSTTGRSQILQSCYFATCDGDNVDDEVCETALELAVAGAEEAMEALEAERSNLSGSDYNHAYRAIYGTYVEAKKRQLSRENPGISLPEYDFDQNDMQRIRELSENPK